MRFGGRRTSSNVGSQRGGGFGLPAGGGGLRLGGRGLGCGGVLAVVVVALVFGVDPLALVDGGGRNAGPPQTAHSGRPAEQICASDPVTRFSCQVLASTEDRWGEIFAAAGQAYRPAELIFYDRRGMSGCGAAMAAMGPFYCPGDQTIYLDTAFFAELRDRFAAPGDFAQAYVIAHEVGHHIQTVTGVADQVRQAQARAGEAEGNALQVRMELQADCYAGVWAAAERAALEPGDVEEGLRAAAAIGDDTLQRAAQGFAVPETFTHGTSRQRMEWLQRGLRSGDPSACDTFAPAP